MSKFMHYKKAAPLLGLTETGLYNLIRSGSVPAARIGGKRGRWYVNPDLVRERLERLMEANIQNSHEEESTEGFLYPKLCRID